MTIQELRILPPLAVGRLGAGSPMDNYNAEVDPEKPLGYRRLTPAETFVVDPGTGEITNTAVPQVLRFTENGKVRSVAPFLEVWALTSEGQLEPLTKTLLESAGLTPAAVTWRVHVGNHKVYRRTGEEADRIEAIVGPFSDHAPHALLGDCGNFWPNKRLPLGQVQYIKPTDRFPEIRLRFTPAHGNVYGSSKEPPQGKPSDPNISDVLYDANKGKWMGHFDKSGDPGLTIPANIYAGDQVGDNWVSKGYLDDECDGLVYVELTVDGRTLTAYGRIGAGPPAYAPDSYPVRTVADELEQAMHGPETPQNEATLAQAEEIIRRAFETVRLMNTAVMNGNTVNGQVDVASTMVRQDTADTGRRFEPIMASSLVDTQAVLNLHQNVFTALRGGTAPWFSDVLREYDQIGDLSSKGRRKMPALMRGADGRYMALTRRQVDLIRKVARRDIFAPEEPGLATPPPNKKEEQG